MKTRIVVLGAGYAGLVAAIRAQRQAGERAEVTLVSARETFEERIRLHQAALGQPLPLLRIADWLEGTGVVFRCATARALDPAKRTLTLENGHEVPFDTLVYALGSRVDLDAVPGVRAHALALDGRTVDRLAATLRPGARVVVVGGGLSGIEAATEIAEQLAGARVTLVTSGSLDEGFSPRAARHLRRVMKRLGVELAEERRVHELRAGVLVESDGRELAFDACVWAGGFQAPPLAREAGLPVNARGQVIVDGTLRPAGFPGIYVAGDAAHVEGHVGSPLHMACKTAMPMGAHAADNVTAALDGRAPEVFAFRDTGVCISLGRKGGLVQARRADGSPWFCFTGRLAAWIKERVCRYTIGSLERERRGKPYRWLRGKPAPAPRLLPEKA